MTARLVLLASQCSNDSSLLDEFVRETVRGLPRFTHPPPSLPMTGRLVPGGCKDISSRSAAEGQHVSCGHILPTKHSFLLWVRTLLVVLLVRSLRYYIETRSLNVSGRFVQRLAGSLCDGMIREVKFPLCIRYGHGLAVQDNSAHRHACQ